MDYFEQLSNLLNKEREFDRQQHNSLIFKRPIIERQALGLTWYPIQITDSELGRGDYLSVTLSRTRNIGNDHKFRFGMPVSLFSGLTPDEDRINGVINYVSNDVMRISFRTDELPDWSRKGRLGIDLLFDENSYKEMDAALKSANELASNENKGTIVRQLLGLDQLNVTYKNTLYQDPSLNKSQNEAVNFLLARNPISLLHGPPGTGKTTTLVKTVLALLAESDEQILIVAPSNIAVDVLTERLAALKVDVVRTGNPVRVSENMQLLTLDAKIKQHTANREARELEKKARAFSEMARKYKRNFGRAEREQRKALLQEAKKIRQEVDVIQQYITTDILNKAKVITATLVGANQHVIKERNYKTVIIDEAAQALEPACWIPILKADSVILAGDHYQLPPTVKHSQDVSNGLYNTLFEKLTDRYPHLVFMLDTQYRMNSQIMEYPSNQLYSGKLMAASNVTNWTLRNDTKPILFIDTAGAGYEEVLINNSLQNIDEANFLIKHLSELIENLKDKYNKEEFPTIGIITPYKQQSVLLKEIIENHTDFNDWGRYIHTSTIDGFQGQEKDIIYISLVRSNDNQTVGFLDDIRRMNVAITRARKKLILIGDSSTIGQHKFYKEFIEYIDSINAYQSVWDWYE